MTESDLLAALQQAQATIPHLQAFLEEIIVANGCNSHQWIVWKARELAALLSAIPAPREPHEEDTKEDQTYG